MRCGGYWGAFVIVGPQTTKTSTCPVRRGLPHSELNAYQTERGELGARQAQRTQAKFSGRRQRLKHSSQVSRGTFSALQIHVGAPIISKGGMSLLTTSDSSHKRRACNSTMRYVVMRNQLQCVMNTRCIHWQGGTGLTNAPFD